MLRKSAAMLFASLAMAGSSARAQAPEDKVFYELSDGVHSAEVSRTGTTCSMLYLSEADKTALHVLVGRTSVTSRLYLMAMKDIGANGAEFDFRRLTTEGMVSDRKAFTKNEPRPGMFDYSSSLQALQLDFDDIQKTGGFLIAEPGGEEGAGLVVKFDGVERDATIAAMTECLASLPGHWSYEG